MRLITIILLLTMNLFSSNIITINDVTKKEHIEFNVDTDKTIQSIHAFTQILQGYFETLHRSLPILTLKQEEWLKQENERTKNSYKLYKELQETYEWKLNETYRKIDFYIKELKRINKTNDVQRIMHDLTSIMNSLRNPYILEYIHSFTIKGLMPSNSLGIDPEYFSDYLLSLEIIVDEYFDSILMDYLLKTGWYISESYLEMNYPK